MVVVLVLVVGVSGGWVLVVMVVAEVMTAFVMVAVVIVA